MTASMRAQLAKVRDVVLPRECDGKKRYITENYARKVMRLRQPLESERLYVYCCPICRGGWHLTRRRHS